MVALCQNEKMRQGRCSILFLFFHDSYVQIREHRRTVRNCFYQLYQKRRRKGKREEKQIETIQNSALSSVILFHFLQFFFLSPTSIHIQTTQIIMVRNTCNIFFFTKRTLFKQRKIFSVTWWVNQEEIQIVLNEVKFSKSLLARQIIYFYINIAVFLISYYLFALF